MRAWVAVGQLKDRQAKRQKMAASLGVGVETPAAPAGNASAPAGKASAPKKGGKGGKSGKSGKGGLGGFFSKFRRGGAETRVQPEAAAETKLIEVKGADDDV